MTNYHYVGLDVLKKEIAYCVKRADGRIVKEGMVAANRVALAAWSKQLPRPWLGVMEATLFTGWIYDFLLPRAHELKVGHPYLLKAICAAKKKNDRVDARKLADALRCDLLPECYMAPAEVRELRRVLRYRNLLVREAVRETIRRAAPGGGYVISSSNSIHPGVKPENYIALARAAREFGRYPIAV
jgi:hypothetical protein